MGHSQRSSSNDHAANDSSTPCQHWLSRDEYSRPVSTWSQIRLRPEGRPCASNPVKSAVRDDHRTPFTYAGKSTSPTRVQVASARNKVACCEILQTEFRKRGTPAPLSAKIRHLAGAAMHRGRSTHYTPFPRSGMPSTFPMDGQPLVFSARQIVIHRYRSLCETVWQGKLRCTLHWPPVTKIQSFKAKPV